MWPRWATGTPTLPTSPRASGIVGVVAGLGGQVEGDRQARLALGQVGAVQLVAGPGRRVARVGPHQPRAIRLGQVRLVLAHVLHGPLDLHRAVTTASDDWLVLSGEQTAGRGQSMAARAASVQVLARGNLDGAERGQVRRHPLDVEQPARRPASTVAAARPGPTSATLEASVRRWNIDSPANRPPMATP